MPPQNDFEYNKSYYSECKNNIEHARTLASNIGQYKINYSDIPSDFSGKGMLLSLSEKVFRLAPQIKNYGTLLENWERHVRDIENIGNEETSAKIYNDSNYTLTDNCVLNYNGKEYVLNSGYNYIKDDLGILPKGLAGTTIFLPEKISSQTQIDVVLHDSAGLSSKENNPNGNSLWKELTYGNTKSTHIIIMPRTGPSQDAFLNDNFQSGVIKLVDNFKNLSGSKEVTLTASSASTQGGIKLANYTQNGQKYFEEVNIIGTPNTREYESPYTKSGGAQEVLRSEIQDTIEKGIKVNLYVPSQDRANNRIDINKVIGFYKENSANATAIEQNLNISVVECHGSDSHSTTIHYTYEQNADFRAKLGLY